MYLAVLVTCPEGSAERIAGEVLKLRLAACVNILGGVRSRYWWRGKLESANESLLLIKTRSELFGKPERAVTRVHPHQTPEMVGLRIEKGNRPYPSWLLEETAPRSRKTVGR